MGHLLSTLTLLLALLAHTATGQPAAVLIAEGDTLLAQNSPSKAMEKFNAALEAGRTADAYAARARGWYYQGKYDKFLADTRDALALDSTHLLANYQRALDALRSEDAAAAITFAGRTLAHGPHPDLRRKALVVRGEAAALAGQSANAIADLEEGLEGNLVDVQAMKTLARLQDAAGNPAASLAVLEKLCELQPMDIGNWSNRGYELNRLERYGDALKILDHALELDKDEPVVLSNKAYALLKLDRDQEALQLINKSLRSDRVNPYALRTRAMLLLRKGERDKACNDLTLAKAMGGAPEVDELVKQHCSGMPRKR